MILDPQVSGVGPKARLPLARSQYDTAVRLSEMDLMGVRRHAVAMPPFLFCSTSDDPRLVADVIAQGNDELATYVADDPDRLLGLASVPLGWPGAAEEARRALDDLGLSGITIGTRGAGKDLDDPVNDDLWALLAERDTFVFMHPSGVPDGPRLHDFYLAQLLGYPMETAIAVSRLVFGGKLERYPLTLCLAHGGGCLPGHPRPTRHGLGTQGCRPHHAAAAERVHGPAVLRHRGLLPHPAAPADRGRRCRPRAARHRPSRSNSATEPRGRR